MPDRRAFLGQLAATAALAAITPRVAFAAPSLHTRPIPGSGELLPVLGLGTASSFDVAASDPREERLRQLLDLFFAGGGRLIDSSPSYGRAETALGRLLAGAAPEPPPFIALKLVAETREEASRQFANSLKTLGVDRVDLLQVHGLRNWRDQLRLAREWQAEGLVRYVGVSHFHSAAHPVLLEALRDERPDFVQVNYSVADWRAEHEVLPAARDAGVAVLVNRCFEDGSLFSRSRGRDLPAWAADFGIGTWAQLFLKFALSHPAVTAAIPTTGNPEHLLDNLGAGSGPDLGEPERASIRALGL